MFSYFSFEIIIIELLRNNDRLSINLNTRFYNQRYNLKYYFVQTNRMIHTYYNMLNMVQGPVNALHDKSDGQCVIVRNIVSVFIFS